MTDRPVAPSLTTRLAAPAVALGAVIAGKALIACRVRRAPEGWRRTLGLLLRSEPTRFALSAFGLRAPDHSSGVTLEQSAAEALRAFLESHPYAHFALEWRDVITMRRAIAHVDVARLDFAASGELTTIEPSLSPDESVSIEESTRAGVHAALVLGYNATRHLPEIDRPSALLHAVHARLPANGDAGASRRYAERLLGSCCVSFEPMPPGSGRFEPPEFARRRGLGFGFLTIVMRVAPGRGSVDVWASAHHVGLDGVPLQDVMSALERAWGAAEPIAFPPPDAERPFMAARSCSIRGEREVEELITFVDLSPVLAVRRSLNERHASEIGGPITVGALLAWLLTREPEFAGLRVASTVDVPASGGYERDVDVVPLKPAEFSTGTGEWGGIVEYAREFNRLIAASKARRSPLRRALQTAGLLPPWAHAHAIRSNPRALDDTFGSLCVTIIRDAKVFVAPMTDLGLGHGFIAIGSTSLPSVDGGRVTAVSIKGDAGVPARSYAALRRVVARCAAATPRATAETRG